MNLKRIFKRNKILSGIGYSIRQNTYTFMMKRYKKIPTDGNKIFFMRGGGAYGDNAKAVAEYIHKNYPEVKLVWSYESSNSLNTLPNYIVPVKYETKDYFREMATSRAWVCCNTLPLGTIKRKDQIYIQTWHADKGFKKFANDAARDLESYRKKTNNRKFAESEICDYFITGADWFVPKIRSALDYSGKIINHGTPRNDCLIYIDIERKNELKNKLGLSENIKVLLYAPTFRDHSSSAEIVDSNIELQTILTAMENKTGDKWVCLLRAHSGKQLIMNELIQGEDFIDVTIYPDMADLLVISDMLITDYSSCAGDFALTKGFILLYQDDYESYTSKDRTLYFDISESPFFVAHNTSEALSIIKMVDKNTVIKNCEDILKFYGSNESGQSAKEVTELIFNCTHNNIN